jgi:nitrogen fixation/metabolism regulation signal transduction histidine kinase
MEAATDQAAQKRVRRRIFRLIDPKFQMKYTLIIVLVGVVVSLALGYFVYDYSTQATEMATMEAAVGTGGVHAEDAEFLARARSEIQSNFDTQVLYLLIAFVVCMAVVLFLWGIIITHKVAGPIFIISRYLRELGEGRAPQTRPLRRGDELKEFFETFSAMLASMKQKNLDEAELLEKSAAQMRGLGGDAMEEAAKNLENLASQKKSWGEASS